MSQIVQTRPVAVVRAAQTDAPRSRIERSMNLSPIQAVAPARDEQVRGDRACAPMPLASPDISGQDLAGGGVDRHPSIPTKFGAANGQHAGSQVDIFELEVARFPQAQARDAEQAKEAVINPREQRAGITLLGRQWHMQRRVQKLLDLLIGVEVRPGPLRLEWQQAERRNLRARAACAS